MDACRVMVEAGKLTSEDDGSQKGWDEEPPVPVSSKGKEVERLDNVPVVG